MTAATAAISTAVRPAPTPATDRVAEPGGDARSLRAFSCGHESTDMIAGSHCRWQRWAAAGVASLLLSASVESVQAAPYVPTDDAQMVERLPTPTGGMKRELRDLRDALAKNPDDIQLAVRLARRYV